MQFNSSRFDILHPRVWIVLFCASGLWISDTTLAIEAVVAREPEPAWVKPLSVDLVAKTPKSAGDGGIWYLLIDSQIDTASDTSYGHYAYRFLSESGVQEYSERSIEFDPAYQTLTLHRLRIHRDGKVIDRLPNQEIRTLDRESGHEEQLYDGQLTSIILMEDIRVGDVLEYAYSVKGHNPLFGDHFSKTKRWSWGITIHHARYRLLWDRDELPLIRTENFDEKPTVTKTDKGHEIIWEQRNTKPIFEESGLPYDFSPYKWIEIGDYKTWDEVRKWARNLYQSPETLPEDLEKKVEAISNLPNEEKKVLAALRFVQDNIRYVGSFMGEHSHRPYEVNEIMDRRFGDCKDKTLILVTMLNKLGIKAEPALVETSLRKEITKSLPSPFDFDHVVTRVSLANKVYWIDPTRSFQRGNSLDKIYFPDYGAALVLDESSAGLATIKSPGFLNPRTEILEVYTLKDYQGDVRLKVKTEYFGLDADTMRSYFSSSSRETIKDSYIDFYATDYPGVSAVEDIVGEDNEDENRFTVKEEYLIKDFWTRDDDDSLWEGSFTPRTVYNELVAPNRAERKMPYRVGHPRNLEHTVKIVLPSKWKEDQEGKEIDHSAFFFSYAITSTANETELKYVYKSKKSQIPAKHVAKYTKEIDRAKDLIGFHYSIPNSYRELDAKDLSKNIDLENSDEDLPYEPNWLATIIALGALFFGILVSVALYFWNPQATTSGDDSKSYLVGRGGWLVVVAFGVFIRPLYGIYSLFVSFGDLDLNVWNELTTVGNEFYDPLWGPMILGNAMFYMFHLPFGILQIVLYLQLRTSFPKVLIAEFVLLLINASLTCAIYQELAGVDAATINEAKREAMKVLFASAIWIPYLLVSVRVHNTFVRRRGERSPSLPDSIDQYRVPS